MNAKLGRGTKTPAAPQWARLRHLVARGAGVFRGKAPAVVARMLADEGELNGIADVAEMMRLLKMEPA